MTMSTISGLAASAHATAALQSPVNPPPGRGAKAAREFEAQLIGTVLESMEKTFACVPGQDQIAGEDELNSMGSHALATALAAGGGFGIARMIAAHLEPRR
jgi:Rod binding domain-containing protein